MKTIQIRLEEKADTPFNGWYSSVNIEFKDVVGVTVVEKQGHQSKKLSWKSIKPKVEKIDFESNTVYFNGKIVKSFEEVQSEIDLIEDKTMIPKEPANVKNIIKRIK